MSKSVCCPKCGLDHVRSIDNQSIYHPSKEEVKKGVPNWDNEIYVEFTCDYCNPSGVNLNSTFTVVFNLVPKK